MLTPGTKIHATFEPFKGFAECEIVSYQEQTSVFACGYFVKLLDMDNKVIFLSKRVIDELYIVIDDKIDEDIYEVKDNGQISFI